jgi:hypothetical protein
MSKSARTSSFVRDLRKHFLGSGNARLRRRVIFSIVILMVIATGSAIADIYLPNLFPFLDPTGLSGTYSSSGSVDLSGPFFQSLGTNGRSCGTCHQPSDAFGLARPAQPAR